MQDNLLQIPKLLPRGYQKDILNRSQHLIEIGKNPIIELDCGLGKRFLQLSLLADKFETSKIILLLQSSTSLYETYNYMIKHRPDLDICLIDSRLPSKIRSYKLQSTRIVVTLPQTLANTLLKFPQAAEGFNILIINEIDQIVKRMGSRSNFKIPYPQLISKFPNSQIIGMSGTLRDDHFILDNDQLKIRKELETLTQMIPNAHFMPMNALENTDLHEHIDYSEIYLTPVHDMRLSFVSLELEHYISEIKEEVLQRLLEEDPELYFDAKRDTSKLFGPLPIEPELITRLHSAYLTRKYLWAMTGDKAKIHLLRLGMDKKYLRDNMPGLPGKFIAIKEIVSKSKKCVILCSYLDTVIVIEQLLSQSGRETISISGKVGQLQRVKNLDHFRLTKDPIVAVLSNVGERDLDIPEADTLIIFDLINTTKTVYQKLKRSRGGTCHILYYSDTKEANKASRVVKSIQKKYSWSIKVKNLIS